MLKMIAQYWTHLISEKKSKYVKEKKTEKYAKCWHAGKKSAKTETI